MTPLLEIKNVRCDYQDTTAVVDASFSLNQGARACLLGPSGCGKTTLLRAIAGFVPVSSGEIYIDGQLVSSPDVMVAPEHRQLGMVFQDHALFPHMTVGDNVAAGISSLANKARRALVMTTLDRVGLAGKIHHYPHELSGGQQQRVALARALAPRPKLLLMDEPFSSLDVELRERLSLQVRELVENTGTTCIMVTHDQKDAFSFGQELGVMGEGKIVQWDSTYEVYHEPNSMFVADFIGQGVYLDGKVIDDHTVKTELGELKGKVPLGCRSGCPVKVLVRPDDVVHDDESTLTARIVSREFHGSNYMYTLELESGTKILSMVHSHHRHAMGEQLGIELELDHLVVFKDLDAQARMQAQA
ncbi:MAG: ABC transporter ATP-binding protein [Arenicellales bacterium]